MALQVTREARLGPPLAQDKQPKAMSYVPQTVILSYCLAAEEVTPPLSGFFFGHLPPMLEESWVGAGSAGKERLF